MLLSTSRGASEANRHRNIRLLFLLRNALACSSAHALVILARGLAFAPVEVAAFRHRQLLPPLPGVEAPEEAPEPVVAGAFALAGGFGLAAVSGLTVCDA